MSFKPQKIETPLNKTRAGKKVINNIKSSTFLPSVFRSSLNNRWLDATLDLMISKGDLEDVNGYVGSRLGKHTSSVDDVYVDTQDFTDLQPTIVSTFENGDTNRNISWDEIKKIDNLEFKNYDYNAAYSTRSYMFTPPINLDRFINYNQYYWVPDLNSATITLNDPGVTNYNPIDELTGKITGSVKTDSGNMTLWNGMILKFSGTSFDQSVLESEYIVLDVGEHIEFRLTSDFNFVTPYTKYVTDPESGLVSMEVWKQKPYTVSNIASGIISSFSKADRWIHIQALRTLAEFDQNFNLAVFSSESRKAKRPIIQINKDIELYNFTNGNYVGVIDYMLDNVRHINTDPNPALITLNITLPAGSSVVFKNNTDPYQNTYYTYIVQPDGVTLNSTLQWGWVSPGDYATIRNDFVNTDKRYSGYDFKFGTESMTRIQTMENPWDAPLYNLRDYNNKWLSDYNQTTFAGSRIFGYSQGTGKVDPELGFAPKYKDTGVKGEIVFVNYLDTERYYTQETQSNVEFEIVGDYHYYQNNSEGNSNYNATAYPFGAPSSWQKTFINNQTDLELDISKNQYYPETQYYNVYLNQGDLNIEHVMDNRIYNDMGYQNIIVHTDPRVNFYDLTPDQSLNIVDFDGNSVATVNGNEHSVDFTTVDYCFIGSTKVMATNFNAYARKFINIKVNGKLIGNDAFLLLDDKIVIDYNKLDSSEYFVVDVEYYSTSADQVVPEVLSKNNNNQKISEFTISETLGHWKNIILSQPLFEGKEIGINNYDITPKTNHVGGDIFVTDSNSLIYNFTYADPNFDLTQALHQQAEELTAFRNRVDFVTKRIYKTEDFDTIRELTDKVLTSVLASMSGDLHRNSNMLYINGETCDEVIVLSQQQDVYDLNTVVNKDKYLTDHIYLYLEHNYNSDNNPISEQLIKNVDYVIENGKIRIIRSWIPFTDSKKVRIHVYHHESMKDCFVPASFAKLGLIQVRQPELITENDYLICHDGAIINTRRYQDNIIDHTQANFNPTAAVLFEIENRIYNNIVNVQDSQTCLSLLHPNIKNSFWFNRHDVDGFIERFYLDYIRKYDPVDTYAFNDSNPFSWNYSSVTVGGRYNDTLPGFWQGAYFTIFGTVNPSRTPWQMLGFNEKPVWWDNHYSWTDPTKREAMINSFKHGIISEPGKNVIQNTRLSAHSWDWVNKCPVTEDGSLVFPNEILGNPDELNRSQDFVFGDWSPKELVWRISPSGQAAMLDALIKLNPTYTWTRVHQPGAIDFFTAQNRSHINKISNKQYSNKSATYHSESNQEQIKKITLLEQSGYIPDGTTVLFSGGTPVAPAEANIFVENGVIKKVELKSNGSGYTNIPNVVLVFPNGWAPQEVDVYGNYVWPKAKFDIVFEKNYEFYLGVDHLLYNSKIRNQFDVNTVSLFKSLEVKVTQPLCGFSDKTLLNIKSESGTNGSYKLGKNDYSLEMTGGKVDDIITASTLKITKTDSGYIVEGYSNFRQEFVYNKVIESTLTDAFTIVVLENDITVKQYHNFETTESVLKYGTKLARIQDVYNFIRGYYHYLTNKGFVFVTQGGEVAGDGMANSFAIWASKSDPDEIFTGQLGQMVSFHSETSTVLPFGSLPGNINSIIGQNSNGEIINVSLSELCITRIDDTLTIHPNDSTFVPEPNESIVTVVTSSVVTNSGSGTLYNPSSTSTQVSTGSNTISQSSSNTQYENIQDSGTVSTKPIDSVLSVTVATTKYYHSIFFNNRTAFNEIINDPILGVKKGRLLIQGQRTNEWKGTKRAPGYLVNDSSLTQNFDSLVDNVSDYYDFNITKFSNDVRKLEKITLGTYARDWINNLELPDNVINKFMQGVIKYKGTEHSVNAFNRGKIVNKGQSDVDITEYWMFKGSDIGDISKTKSTEILIKSEDARESRTIINLNDTNLEYVNKENLNQFTIVDFDALGITHRKGGDLLINEYDYVVSQGIDIPEVFDNDADYANILTWDTKGIYKKGDLVRKDGFLYECNVPYIGFATTENEINIIGTLDVQNTKFAYANPTTDSPSATIDGVNVWFDKTRTVYPDIIALSPPNTGLSLTGSFIINVDNNEIIVSKSQESVVVDTDASFSGLPAASQIQAHDTDADVTGLFLIINGVTVNVEDYGTVVPLPVDDLEFQFIGDGQQNTYVLDTQGNVITSGSAVFDHSGYTATFNSNFSQVTITPQLSEGDIVDITLVTADNQKITLTPEQLSEAINTNNELSNQSISADIDDNIVTIVRDTGIGRFVPDTYLPLTIGSSGSANGVLNFVPATYSVVTVTIQTDAAMDIEYIAEVISTGLPSNRYDVNIIGDSIQIIKIASGHTFGPESFLQIGNELAEELGFINDDNPDGIYNIIPINNVPTECNAQEAVDFINQAGITDVAASLVNNRIVIIKDTSDAVQLDLGSTNFNILAGIPSGIISVEKNSGNEFLTSQWKNVSVQDPALFNIWTLNDSSLSRTAVDAITATFNSWNVMQIQQVPAYAIINAGNESADGNDAKISLFSSVSGIQTTFSRQSIRPGDYVMLLNTTTTPSVTGIHLVTEIEAGDTNSFYIDKFIEVSGRAEAVFVLRNARFQSYNDLINAMSVNNNSYNFTVGTNMWLTQGQDGKPGTFVYTYTGNGSVELLRKRSWYVDNSSIDNIKIYDAQKNHLLTKLEVFDPLQGIIPGAADREIDVRYPVDVAVYNTTNDTAYDTNQRNAWGEAEVGKIWWDTSTVYYLDYKQSSTEYAVNHWGQQIENSSIDVYEWTKSSVTPDKWADEVNAQSEHFGSIATGEAYRIYDKGTGTYIDYYTEDTYWNEQFNRYDSVYYFWVKNKTTITNENKTLTTTDIANIITNPTASGIPWCASVDENTFVMDNIGYLVNDHSSVIQVNMKENGNYHSSWTLISEKTDVIPDYYYIGLQDNLVGQQSVTGQSLPSNELHEYNRYGDQRNIIKNYNNSNKFLSQAWFKDPWDARREAIEIINRLLLNQNLVYDLDTKWDRVLKSKFFIIPEGTEELDELPFYQNIDTWNEQLIGKKVVVDGVLYYWSGSEWFESAGWDMNLVWDYADYYDTEYQLNTVTPSLTIKSKNDLSTVDTFVHKYVKVRQGSICGTGKPSEEIYHWRINDWVLVKKTNATIQFNNLVWKRNNLFAWDMQSWEGVWDFDPSPFMHWIIKACREDLFIETHIENFNHLFFGMVRYIAGLHTQVDWFYKTTYIKLNLDTSLVTSNTTHKLPKQYYRNNIDLLEDFVNQVKPFHTKILTRFGKNYLDDYVYAETTEIKQDKYIEMMYPFKGHNATFYYVRDDGTEVESRKNVWLDNYSKLVPYEGMGATWLDENGNPVYDQENDKFFTWLEYFNQLLIPNLYITVYDEKDNKFYMESKHDYNGYLEPELDSLSFDNPKNIYSATFEPVADALNGGDFTDFNNDTVIGEDFTTVSNYNTEVEEYRRHVFDAIMGETLSVRVQTNKSGSTVDDDTRTFVWIISDSNKIAAFGLTESRATVINNDVSVFDTNVEVADISLFNRTGGLAYTIGGEIFSYSGIYQNKLVGLTRGLGETIVKPLAEGSQIISVNDMSLLQPFSTTESLANMIELPWKSNPVTHPVFDIESGKSILDPLSSNTQSLLLQSHEKGIAI